METTQHFRFVLLVLVLIVGLLDLLGVVVLVVDLLDLLGLVVLVVNLLDLLGLVVVVEDRLGVLIRYTASWNSVNSAVTGTVLEQREIGTCNQTSQPIAKC